MKHVPRTKASDICREEYGSLTMIKINCYAHRGFDVILAVPGRIPLTKNLGLKKVGVKLTKKGGYINGDNY